MKNFLTFITSFFACTVCSAKMPTTWNAYFYNIEEKTNITHVKMENDHVILPDNTKVTSKTISSRDNRFDFDKLTDKNHVVLSGKIYADKDMETYIGIGCLAFALELNGKNIYEFRRRGLGNDFDPISTDDHIIPVKLKKGENTIVIYSCRTNWLLDYCYGAERKINWNFAIALRDDYKPVKAELAYSEFMLRPTDNSISCSFITKESVPAGIEYREAGSEKWNIRWDLSGELVLIDKQRNHIICIDGLKPATKYEYRIVMLQPPAGGEKRSLWGTRFHKKIYTPVKTFTTLGAKELRFIALADTQLSIASSLRTVADREKYMAAMRELPEFKQSDFIAHLGDMTSYFHDLEKDLFCDFLESFSSQKDAKPWVYVRGNHEMNGLDSSVWHDYFVPDEQKPYYSFKSGNAIFIIIACSDFTKGENNAYMGPILDSATMIRKQREWLKELIQSDDFKNAKFRIVMSHITPQFYNDQVINEIRKIADPLMNENIHLWLGGHCHRYWRMFKGSDILYSRENVTPPAAYPVAKFNWITLDGPKGNQSKPDLNYISVHITENMIEAKTIDPDGSIVDHFTIDADGKATLIKHAPELTPKKLK